MQGASFAACLGSFASPDNVLAGHLYCKGGEVALHARRDKEGASRGVQAGNILDVGHLLLQDLMLIKPACRSTGGTGAEVELNTLWGMRAVASPASAMLHAPAMVVDALPEQLNGALCVILVHLWHVLQRGHAKKL